MMVFLCILGVVCCDDNGCKHLELHGSAALAILSDGVELRNLSLCDIDAIAPHAPAASGRGISIVVCWAKPPLSDMVAAAHASAASGCGISLGCPKQLDGL